jgi:hypothetical protein
MLTIRDQKGNERCHSNETGGGTVFELSPPTGNSKQWSERVLWKFGVTSGDGQNPHAA